MLNTLYLAPSARKFIHLCRSGTPQRKRKITLKMGKSEVWGQIKEHRPNRTRKPNFLTFTWCLRELMAHRFSLLWLIKKEETRKGLDILGCSAGQNKAHPQKSVQFLVPRTYEHGSSTGQRGICWCDSVKVLERQKVAYIIHFGPIKPRGPLRVNEGGRRVRESFDDALLVALKMEKGVTGQAMQAVCINWKRQENGFCLWASRRNSAFPTPWL